MTTQEERNTIIDLLATSKITVPQAELLLDALNSDQPTGIELEFYTEKADLGATLHEVSALLEQLAAQV